MDTKKELVRRKLLGCRTTPSKGDDMYFLASCGDLDIFVNLKTQDIKGVYLHGTEIYMGGAIGVHSVIQQESCGRNEWQALAGALKEYLECQQNSLDGNC